MVTSTDRRQGVNSGAAVKVPCRVATTGAITLSGLQTVDGIALSTDDRVLVKNQASSVSNGIYLASTSTWNLAPDCDGAFDLKRGTLVLVNEGTTNNGKWFVVSSSDPITIGSTSLSFAAVAGDGTASALSAALAASTGSSLVGYIDSGAGATATTAQSVLREFPVSVKRYGATGLGIADDLAAIQAAIDSGAKCIYFPAGTYRTSAAINLSGLDGVTLIGAGRESTVIVCDLSVTSAIVIGGSALSTGVQLHNMTISRAAGTPPTNSVGILGNWFNYFRESNVRCTRHYYGRKITSNQASITIGYIGESVYADNCTRAYLHIEDTAECHLSHLVFGRNGGESYDPVYCIEISGEANDVVLDTGTLVPRGPRTAEVAMVAWTNYVSLTGVFQFNNLNTENLEYGLISDGSTASITELRIQGGRYASENSSVEFNSGTQLINCSFTGATFPQDVILDNPKWTRVVGCGFGTAATLDGGADGHLAFIGNTITGSWSAAGAWDDLTLIGNAYDPTSFTFTATGKVCYLDATQFGVYLDKFTVDTSGNTAVAGTLNVNDPSRAAQASVHRTSNTNPGSIVHDSQASPTGDIMQLVVDAAASGDTWFFERMYSNAGSSIDVEFSFNGAGTGLCDGSWTGGGADYAEYFEWADGNPANEDRRGVSVMLAGAKIAPAVKNGDHVFGVVSARPSIVGDAAWNKWAGKYIMDEFGSYVLDENGHRIVSETFDQSLPYLPREKRKEWACIGLMGKLRVRNSSPVNPRWTKMREVSPDVSEWLIK